MKLDNEVTYQGKHLYLKKQKNRAKSGIERKIKVFEAKEQRFPMSDLLKYAYFLE